MYMLHPRYFLNKVFPSHAYTDLPDYATDVLEHEPPDPLILLSGRFGKRNSAPHVGSRTFESVVRQAIMAGKKLVAVLRGERF